MSNAGTVLQPVPPAAAALVLLLQPLVKYVIVICATMGGNVPGAEKCSARVIA